MPNPKERYQHNYSKIVLEIIRKDEIYDRSYHCIVIVPPSDNSYQKGYLGSWVFSEALPFSRKQLGSANWKLLKNQEAPE